MSQSNEVRYTARSITPPADRDSTPPPKRRTASSRSPPLPPPPPFPPKGVVRIISSRSPPPKRRSSSSRSPPPKRRGRSRSPSPKKRARSRSPSPKKRGRSRSPSPKKRGRSRSPSPKKRGRSRSPSPKKRGRSRSRNRSRSRSRDELRNPGNNLYVTGLSTRTSSESLEKFFGKEGKVQDCRIVIDPRTKEPRGFAFVTMENVEDARRCIKYLHRTVLEGRLISVEKEKEKLLSFPCSFAFLLLSSPTAASMLLGCLNIDPRLSVKLLNHHRHWLLHCLSAPTLLNHHQHRLLHSACTNLRPEAVHFWILELENRECCSATRHQP